MRWLFHIKYGFQKGSHKIKKINVRSLPERLREFYINFFFFVFVFFFDRTLCHRNCHILSLCRYVKNIHVFLVGSGYYNDWHFLLFSYWLIDRTLCHTKCKMCHILSFSKISLGGGSGETCVTWNRLRDFFLSGRG